MAGASTRTAAVTGRGTPVAGSPKLSQLRGTTDLVMETRSLFEPDAGTSGEDAAAATGGGASSPDAVATPEVTSRQSRIRALNTRRRSLQTDRDRNRRRVNARRRARVRLDEMDDESRAEWQERRRRLHVLT